MRYAKAIVAVLAAAAVAVQAALTDDVITTAEWVTIALTGVGAIGVYAVPNRDARPTGPRPAEPAQDREPPQPMRRTWRGPARGDDEVW